MSGLSKDALMRLAATAAKDGMADGRGGPFGAVIAQDGVVIAAAANRVVRDKDPTAHAEICAIREACRIRGTHVLAGCEIFATCEPCPMCLSAIYWSRIDRIYFASTREDAARIGFDDAAVYEEVAAPMSQRRIEIIQIKSDESARLFDFWRNMTNKISY